MAFHKCVTNEQCEFYPCHNGIEGSFNCLFCYCPLYALGEHCGGNPTYLANGIKDCSDCDIIHRGPAAHDFVMKRIVSVIEMAKRPIK